MPNRRELGYVSSWNTVANPVDAPYGVATGGSSSSITVGTQAYTLLTFTSTGTLTVTKAGLFDVLMVGGGGGGGAIGAGDGGGGGGGGRRDGAPVISPSAGGSGIVLVRFKV